MNKYCGICGAWGHTEDRCPSAPPGSKLAQKHGCTCGVPYSSLIFNYHGCFIAQITHSRMAVIDTMWNVKPSPNKTEEKYLEEFKRLSEEEQEAFRMKPDCKLHKGSGGITKDEIKGRVITAAALELIPDALIPQLKEIPSGKETFYSIDHSLLFWVEGNSICYRIKSMTLCYPVDEKLARKLIGSREIFVQEARSNKRHMVALAEILSKLALSGIDFSESQDLQKTVEEFMQRSSRDSVSNYKKIIKVVESGVLQGWKLQETSSHDWSHRRGMEDVERLRLTFRNPDFCFELIFNYNIFNDRAATRNSNKDFCGVNSDLYYDNFILTL